MARSTTRTRMIDTAVGLFQRQGYRATSWRTLVKEGGTPWGSVQHHFPGGKEELGVAAVARAGELVEALLRATMADAPDPVTGVRTWFALSAAALQAGEYANGCPVAPVVLEMAQESGALARACAAALDRWVEVVAEALRAAGLDADTSVALGTTVVSAFEGALVIARARRTTEPLALVGPVVADAIEAGLRPHPR